MVVISATVVVHVRHSGRSSAAVRGVETGHEFAVGGAGGVEVLGAFLEVQADVDDVLFEGDDALVELVDVGGCAETRLAPGLLAERLGQSPFQVLDAGCETGCSFVCGEQVGL